MKPNGAYSPPSLHLSIDPSIPPSISLSFYLSIYLSPSIFLSTILPTINLSICLSLSGTPTVTFCSVHIHNVVAKKRDASTDLLRQHNVDFLGSDFNMSAFSTVGDVFSNPEFSALGKSFLWGLGALEEQNRERTGFLICQSDHMTGVLIHMAATNIITLHLALDPEIKPLTFLCSFISAPPTYLVPTASCAASKRNKEGLSADITNPSACGDDVLDCDVAHQSHVSAHLFPSSPITCESPVACCFAPH